MILLSCIFDSFRWLLQVVFGLANRLPHVAQDSFTSETDLPLGTNGGRFWGLYSRFGLWIFFFRFILWEILEIKYRVQLEITIPKGMYRVSSERQSSSLFSDLIRIPLVLMISFLAYLKQSISVTPAFPALCNVVSFEKCTGVPILLNSPIHFSSTKY